MVLLQIYMWRLLHKLFVMAVVNSVHRSAFCRSRHTCFISASLVTVLEVLAGNGVTAMVDSDMDFVPTPSISRAIIRYNESHDDKADGIVITPSHNPPDNGGIKYNATNGGPADTLITKWIETRANEYVHAYCELEGFKRISIDNIEPDQQVPYDYKGLYVEELSSIINMEAIQSAN